MNIDTRIEYVPGDPLLIKNIVTQLKSQGVFDQFRKECISDVDTKPAYQNLCHRVDGRVEDYLSNIKWGPDINKNQLRENIRKHINECSFVESGISRIVDQLVNPRINTVLVPKVEAIVYNYLGIERTEDVKPQINDSMLEKREKSEIIIKEESNNSTSDRKVSSSSSHRSNLLLDRNTSSDDTKSGKKQENLSTMELINRNSISACSDIESDEDDISPPFEPHEKSDVDLSAESDYSLDIPDTKFDVKCESSITIKQNVEDILNTERICKQENIKSEDSPVPDETNSRKPSVSLDLPKTPNINYDTSDESQDNYLKRKNSIQVCQESNQSEICLPDTSSTDSSAEKTVENVGEDIECIDSAENWKNKEKTLGNEKEIEDIESNRQKRNEIKSNDSKDMKHRDPKQYDDKKDQDRKSKKDKDRSRHDNKNRSSKEKSDRNRSNKEHGRSSSRSENDRGKNHKNYSDEKNLKDRDTKHRESMKLNSNCDRQDKTSRIKNDDSKDKKKSTLSRHDSEKNREKKHRKEENSEIKKNKSQCSTDEKKARNDRRSSDRDSNGPSSSSRNSSHSKLSKSDKEKYSEKHKHSSSSTSSSSHKKKKNSEAQDGDRVEDLLISTMMTVTGSESTLNENMPQIKPLNIENTSSLLDILNDFDESKNINTPNNENITSTMEIKTKKEKLSIAEKHDEKVVDAVNEKKKKENRHSKKMELKNTVEGKKKSVCNNKMSSSALNEVKTEIEQTEVDVKKPKIAKNAADILRIMELRKQYKEKIKSDQLTQQDKENANLKIKRETTNEECDQNFVLNERLVDNHSVKKSNQNEKIVHREADLTILVNDIFDDYKLKTKKVDPRNRVINGSYAVDSIHKESCVRSDNELVMNDDHTTEISNELKNSMPKEKYSEQNVMLFNNDVKINGSLKDSKKMSHCAEKTSSVISENRLSCDKVKKTRESIVKKACLLEEIDEVHYFESNESSELNDDFKNFVAKRIRESEEIYLEKFSIYLTYPERYDYIFRNRLGATVKRKNCNNKSLSSPFKYNSEIINNAEGNERTIMMRIKKTHQENKTVKISSTERNSSTTWESDLNVQSTNTFGSVDDNFVKLSVNASSIAHNKVPSGKRKTLGIKRRLSNNSKVTGDESTKIVKLNHNFDSYESLNSKTSFSYMQDSKTIGIENVESELPKAYDVPNLSTSDTQKGFMGNLNVVQHSETPNSKIQKRSLEELKRKQFYYDEGDLYKPRPSFLISSRRSRGLNADKT